MPSPRPKPPKENKADLMEQIIDRCQAKWPHQPDAALRHILNYFTTIDLEAIRNEMGRP